MFKEIKKDTIGNARMYLQIEKNGVRDRVVFKVQVDNEKSRSEIRNHIWKALSNLDKTNINEAYRFQKTNFSNGRTMTIAEIVNFETKQQLNEGIKEAEIQLNMTFEVLRY